MSEQNCGNCRFWMKDDDYPEEKMGWCRRYPPQLSEFGPDGFSNGCDPMSWAFPRMMTIDWCGEHQPINQLQGGSVASGDAASETGVDR